MSTDIDEYAVKHERIAKAIFDAWADLIGHPDRWSSDLHESTRDKYWTIASEVVDAIEWRPPILLAPQRMAE